jgi:hypothetical protein
MGWMTHYARAALCCGHSISGYDVSPWELFTLVTTPAVVWFALLRLLKGKGQQPLTSLIDNLNSELVLLVRRKIAPVRNDFHEEPGDSSGSITCGINVRQIKALGILDTIVLITNEKNVLGHSDRNISQHGHLINLPRGIG